MKIDFWQLSGDPVEKVVALIAGRVMASGERLLIVAAEKDQRAVLSRALWQAGPDSFLANGDAGGDAAGRQPILLSSGNTPDNGASHVIYADGEWSGAEGFERAFLLFDDRNVENARATWRSLDETLAQNEDAERAFYRQDNGKWSKIA